MASCYRHTGRETGVSCSNCGRPICPDCMTPTSVGMRCPECARARTPVRRMRPRGPGLSVTGRRSATDILIAINVAVFLAEVATGVTLGGGGGGWVFEHGALYGPLLANGAHEYWRLLTAGFLHASLLHIAFNMLSLYFIGRALEPGIGSRNFLWIYVSALLAGSFGALLFEPDSPTVGASTAIFGSFAALLVVAYRRGLPIWQSGLAPIFLFNVVFTLSDRQISIGGHLGGIVAGAIGGWAVVELAERRRLRLAVPLVSVAVMVVSVIGAVLVAGSTGLTPTG